MMIYDWINQKRAVGILLLLLVAACGNEKDLDDVVAQSTGQPVAKKMSRVVATEPVMVKGTILLDDLRVRKSAGSQGQVVDMVSSGAQVQWTGAVSDNRTPLKLRDVAFNDPWIEIITPKQKKGWVYAAALMFKQVPDEAKRQVEDFYHFRAEGFFGKALADEMRAYRHAYATASSAQVMASVYVTGQKIRQKMVSVLESKAAVAEPKPIDMSWLELLIPGYEVRHAAEGTLYYLFANFKQMEARAQSTEGVGDEVFMQLLQKLYPYNGTEGFYFSWFEQTWDYGGDSLLGQGRHIAALKTMESAIQQAPAFKPHILFFKRELIKDIIDKNTQFRASVERRKEEIETIIQSGLSIITQEDKEALKMRQQSF